MKITIYTLASSADPNNIRYVGKTRQTIKRRLQGHICCAKKALEKGCSTNHNYNWINKELQLGNTIIIEEVESLDFLENESWDWFEKYWIAQFKIWGFKLTNIREGGEDNYVPTPTKEVIEKRASKIIGKPRSLEVKEKISKELSGIEKSEEIISKIKDSVTKKQGRPVLQLDKTSKKVIKEWESGSEAARVLHLDKSNLNACCKGKKKSCGGYIWEYKYPDVIPERRIVQLNAQGEFIKIFKNSAEVETILGINSNLVNNVCKGKQKETYHCYFKYYNDFFKN